MYSYSFAIHPEKHQPSGTVNVSKIDPMLCEILNATYNFERNKEYIFYVSHAFLKSNIVDIISLSIKNECSIMVSIDKTKWDLLENEIEHPFSIKNGCSAVVSIDKTERDLLELTNQNKVVYSSDNIYIKFCRLGG
jgi:hypothetical protein